MFIVSHRRNTIAQLKETPENLGVEVDIRCSGPDLIIHHDAFVEGEKFDDWLAHYRHGLLILNVKEEGLEDALLERMAKAGITDFFFLDQSFPFLVRTANRGERRCAVRVSEFESIDTALTLAGRIDWIWVDCFTRFPLEAADAERLRAAGFKLCLVSPELQGRTDPEAIAAMRHEVTSKKIHIDAVCTKRPDLWR